MLHRSIYQALSTFSLTLLVSCAPLQQVPSDEKKEVIEDPARAENVSSREGRRERAERDSVIKNILKPKARNQSVRFPEDKDLKGLESQSIIITLPERLNVRK